MDKDAKPVLRAARANSQKPREGTMRQMRALSVTYLIATGVVLLAIALSHAPAYSQQASIISEVVRRDGGDTVRFAVIGDYGLASQNELAVANLVKSWNPSFIITTGDNNYWNGAAATIDQNIGQYYHDFIYPYVGSYGTGPLCQYE